MDHRTIIAQWNHTKLENTCCYRCKGKLTRMDLKNESGKCAKCKHFDDWEAALRKGEAQMVDKDYKPLKIQTGLKIIAG